MTGVGEPPPTFTRSTALLARLRSIVPGGSHTYAKGWDQYPVLSPGVLVRGRGCHVWDADDNEFIEYGMGLRSVGLGHAYPAVIDAVRDSLEDGTNFTRPSSLELTCAERFLDIVGTADMVKFTKDGSTATSSAVKLARAATGRDLVAICRDHPFFSYDDWFITTTSMHGGINAIDAERTVTFAYDDEDSLRTVLESYPGQVAAVMMEPVRTSPPKPGYLEAVRRLCTEHGSVLVFDEMITGFRYDLHGAQRMYGVTPDLSTWGKALANGFSLSALAGSADLMRLGSRERPEDNVFLLSTTHGAESTALAAAIATMDVYEREPVVEHMYRIGERLAVGLREVAERHGVGELVQPVGFPCNLMFSTLDAAHAPSQPMRTLLLQETCRRGVLMPSLVVSYSHDDGDVDRTLEALDGALAVYARALESDVHDFLVGAESRVVYDRRWR